MFHKLIYQKKAAFTDADARDFSTKDYTCVKLLLTKRGRPVAILESNDTKNWHWRVQYGFPQWSSNPMPKPCSSAVSVSLT